MERKDYYIAIDLGSRNVVVGVGEKAEGEKLRVVDLAVVPVQGQGVSRGEIKNIESVAKSIKDSLGQIETRLGIKVSEAYTGISGHHIKCAKHSYFVYVGRDGEICEEDIVKLKDSMQNVQPPEGEKILKILPQNYIIDGQEEATNPVGMFGKKLEATFNFIIGNKVVVSRLEKALTKVNIKQLSMFLNPLLSAEAVVLDDEKEMGVAVVDIGAGTTDICIYCDNTVRHVAVVPVGADIINRDIRAYGILERYVEDLKVQCGSAMSEDAASDKLIQIPGRTPREISFKNLSAIIEARMKDILDYVMAEIKQTGLENKLAAGIVITGGGANLKDLDALIREYTNMEVRIAYADVNVSEDSLDKVTDPAYSTVVGMLYQAMQCDAPKSFEVNIVETKPEQIVEPVKEEVPETKVEDEPKKAEEPKKEQKPLRHIIEEDDFEQDAEQAGGLGARKETAKPKAGFLGRLKNKFSEMFDVIDDNEF